MLDSIRRLMILTLVASTIIIKYKVINMNSNEISSCDRKLRVEI